MPTQTGMYTLEDLEADRAQGEVWTHGLYDPKEDAYYDFGTSENFPDWEWAESEGLQLVELPS
jgi:hypothetical protein